MSSEAAIKAKEIGVDLPGSLDPKFVLLEKLINFFTIAKNNNDSTLDLEDECVLKVKNDLLIDKLGMSEEVAKGYIKAALERV